MRLTERKRFASEVGEVW